MSDDEVLTGSGTRTRRALLAGAGAVGASVVLAGCGGDDEGAAPPASTPTSGGPGATGAPSAADAPLARTTDIPVGGGAIFVERGVVVTQPTEGEFKGFDPICTHQRCPVSNVDGGTINCTCHNSRFAITDGSVQGGPATKPLPAKQVKVEGGQVYLA
ncbi:MULTISPECIES: Rieske (2Fe-2S) protein [unclassified Micromonospora]|uniref:Rieske (2Fe-2S) protein n=1 Tax=unclassified Micromonospora TaxID=2617518 RepID=UPI00104ECC64|nr:MULTISPECIES: Rieske (2Fe-2S) protein [unclassified Micromonospora]TDB70581.1 Rieske (2Fe-2S) protein [Micromonospora sp. KC721]TDC34744.1 Rieske (2Fe-2S) protein [Micromonospora sp. KC213]